MSNCVLYHRVYVLVIYLLAVEEHHWIISGDCLWISYSIDSSNLQSYLSKHFIVNSTTAYPVQFAKLVIPDS